MQDTTRKTELDRPRWLHPEARALLRDDDLMVVEKPSGVLSHPNPPERRSPRALVQGVYDLRRECYRVPGRAGEIFLVHRLDQETSGLLLLAFSQEIARKLQGALAERNVDKLYRAVLLGVPRPPSGTWRDRLEKRSGRGRAKVLVRPGEPNAVTHYETEASLPGAGVTVVSLHPLSGRTHQLRVQAAARRLPILGDPLYGDFIANRHLSRELGVKRMLLHATRLEFEHPSRGGRTVVESPAPAEWEAALAAVSALRAPLPRRARPPSAPRRPRR